MPSFARSHVHAFLPPEGLKLGVFVGVHPTKTPHSTVLREHIAKTSVPTIALIPSLNDAPIQYSGCPAGRFRRPNLDDLVLHHHVIQRQPFAAGIEGHFFDAVQRKNYPVANP
jgi:hypothetical protein